MGERERALPDLKRQIRTSLKSITEEPCTDFISWKMCAAKGMQTDIDVWDWLISSFLKNVHTELQYRVCFGFVCFLSARSILNTSSPRDLYRPKTNAVFTQQITISQMLSSDTSKIDSLQHSDTWPASPLPFATTSRKICLPRDLKIDEQKWHSSLLHLKRVHLVTMVASQKYT